MHGITDEPRGRAELRCSHPTAETVLVELSGSWRLQDEFPSLADVEQSLEDTPRVQRMTFDTTGLTAWDSGLVTFLLELITYGARHQVVVDQEGLPEGVRRLLHLATAVPERQGARRETTVSPSSTRIGNETLGPGRIRGRHPRFHRRGHAGPGETPPRPGALPPGRAHGAHPGVRRPGLAHRHLDLFSGRGHPGLHRGGPTRHVWGADLCGQSGRHGDDAGDGGDDDRHHHGRSDRGRLCGSAGHDDGERRNRCPDHPRPLAHGIPGGAAHAGAGDDDAAA